MTETPANPIDTEIDADAFMRLIAPILHAEADMTEAEAAEYDGITCATIGTYIANAIRALERIRDVERVLDPHTVAAAIDGSLAAYACADCGTTTATTYAVTQLDPADDSTRTEVCQGCDDRPVVAQLDKMRALVDHFLARRDRATDSRARIVWESAAASVRHALDGEDTEATTVAVDPADLPWTVVGFDTGDYLYVAGVLAGHVGVELQGGDFDPFADHVTAESAEEAAAVALAERG